jgi:hypothetical protein
MLYPVVIFYSVNIRDSGKETRGSGLFGLPIHELHSEKDESLMSRIQIPDMLICIKYKYVFLQDHGQCGSAGGSTSSISQSQEHET